MSPLKVGDRVRYNVWHNGTVVSVPPFIGVDGRWRCQVEFVFDKHKWEWTVLQEDCEVISCKHATSDADGAPRTSGAG